MPDSELSARTWGIPEVLQAARLYYEKGLTQVEIAKYLHRSRQVIGRMLKWARNEGIVQVQIAPRLARDYLVELERGVQSCFPLLKRVIIVPGVQGILEDTLIETDRNGLLSQIAKATAQYLDSILEDGDVLVVGRGLMSRLVANHLRPTRLCPGLKVLPIVGFVASQPEDSDANIVAADVARIYGGRYFWLTIPAFVKDPRHNRMVGELPLAKETLKLTNQANIVLTGIGPPKYEYLIQAGLATRQDIIKMEKLKVVGQIGTWHFDVTGHHVPVPWEPVGLGINGLKRMVRNGRSIVIGIAGGNKDRVLPLEAALRGGIINVLATDHITTAALVGFPLQD